MIAVQDEEHQQGILPVICAQLGLERLWLVHRLDKVTSGLLILAKSESAAAEFGRLFEAHQMEKVLCGYCVQKAEKETGNRQWRHEKSPRWLMDTR